MTETQPTETEWRKQYGWRIQEAASSLSQSFSQIPRFQNLGLFFTILEIIIIKNYFIWNEKKKKKKLTNTRRVPSESVFEPLAVHFDVQSDWYQILGCWPAMPIDIITNLNIKKKNKIKRKKALHPELDGWGLPVGRRWAFHGNLLRPKPHVIN